MEKNNKKQTGKRSYGSLFLKKHSMSRRGEKAIYVRKEYHERLSRIVQVIGGGDIPLYAYLDNILKHHFELFSEDIVEDFYKRNKPIL
ncbi:DUF3408 domain-containing protein [Sphingobacterium humi]|uniref:DUF3408 domain-containing protein n=1 Tax=Sphingobacterium humi TaxID=1796905 RepID=A0A6N8L1Z9_9SPHI|nr:DUF3408 domain-containing protein [Sphingobacterium humi]MVZ63740.1 DUF3408 domain-containing protein [Sphingobacterium humi]